MTERQMFRSSITTVLTMIGVAVGLGNVWRFPYMMGRYGGSAFLFLFLFFVLFFAIPAVAGEWALGRATRKGPMGAFSIAFGPKAGKWIGYLLFATVLIADAYYILVIAYISYTFGYAGFWGFDPNDLTEFNAGLNSGPLQYAIALVLVGLSVWVLLKGLNRGIERISTMFIPFFGLIVVVLIVHSLSLEGAWQHLIHFLEPDFSAMMDAETIFAAMGQAIFSLSLGGTFFVIYGSYLRREENLPVTAAWTGLGDAGAALLASFFIVPTVLVFGLELGQGPTLIFDTLPRLFGGMNGGRFWGTAFLLGLMLVAFLSSLAALQVAVGGLSDYFSFSNKKAVLTVGLIEAALILPVALNPSLISKLDLIFGSGMQCLGSALALLALTSGLGKSRAITEIFSAKRPRWAGFFFVWLRWAIPLALFATLLMYIIENVLA